MLASAYTRTRQAPSAVDVWFKIKHPTKWQGFEKKNVGLRPCSNFLGQALIVNRPPERLPSVSVRAKCATNWGILEV